MNRTDLLVISTDFDNMLLLCAVNPLSHIKGVIELYPIFRTQKPIYAHVSTQQSEAYLMS